jgi:hypothetical protein
VLADSLDLRCRAECDPAVHVLDGTLSNAAASAVVRSTFGAEETSRLVVSTRNPSPRSAKICAISVSIGTSCDPCRGRAPPPARRSSRPITCRADCTDPSDLGAVHPHSGGIGKPEARRRFRHRHRDHPWSTLSGKGCSESSGGWNRGLQCLCCLPPRIVAQTVQNVLSVAHRSVTPVMPRSRGTASATDAGPPANYPRPGRR